MEKSKYNKKKRERFNYTKGKISFDQGNNKEEVYTTGEVAKIFNVSRQTVTNWCNEGRLAFHLFQGKGAKYAHRRIKKSDLRRMRDENVAYFEPSKTVQVPGSVIPMIDNQIRIWNQQSSRAREDDNHKLADKIDAWIDGINTARRIVARSITEVELEPYRENGVDYYL